MSADNGIYMLRTLTEDGRHEWRVAEMSAIDNLWWDENRHDFAPGDDDVVIENARQMFAEIPAFSTQEEALKAAANLSRATLEVFGFLEYGINEIPVDRVF